MAPAQPAQARRDRVPDLPKAEAQSLRDQVLDGQHVRSLPFRTSWRTGSKASVKAAARSRRPRYPRPVATAVVTGGAGFLGSHLCDALLAKGMRVVCVDNLDTGNLANIEHIRTDAFTFVNHDLTRHLELAEPVDFVYPPASPA